jgi:hypothetical protein
MTAPMSREQVEALPPAIDLPTLGRVLGLSEPTVRACQRNGDLERAGIRVVKLGAQYRVVTASVLAALGLGGSDSATRRIPPKLARLGGAAGATGENSNWVADRRLNCGNAREMMILSLASAF